MKIRIPLILALLLTSAMANAAPQSPVTVAVYDFKGDAEAASYGSEVTTLVTADLTTETNLVLVERAQLMKALKEQAFGISGMVSSDAAAKIGQLTGAKVLVAGQVINTDGDHLIIVANIIGTETARLFADKVEGAAGNLTKLTSDLSREIAQTITDHATNLVLAAQETSAERLDRIINNIQGTNRPTISVSIIRHGKKWRDAAVQDELGAILLKAGFTVVDNNSDSKPDVEITGGDRIGAETHQGGVFSCSANMELKIQDRRTGNIITFERQESTATDEGRVAAQGAALVRMADDMAEKIIPILAQ